MDTGSIVRKLHALERRVLPLIGSHPYSGELASASGLMQVEVLRAMQWLQNKGMVELEESASESVQLDKNGLLYLKEGLPEKRFLRALNDGAHTLEDIREQSKLCDEELNISIGTLKRKGAIDTKREATLTFTLTALGKQLLDSTSGEEKLIASLENPRQVADIKKEEMPLLEELKRRKQIVRVAIIKEMRARLTKLGEEVVEGGIDAGHIADHLTIAMLRDGTWKGKEFRSYELSASTPRMYGGRRHFVGQAVEYARRIWLELGFKEMRGPIVNTSFWNFDSLFTAQDHPVRELQDTFFIKEPALGRLPAKALVERVKAAHENGGTTGSKGWQYAWSQNDARKNVLRTHTTVLSARTIASLKKSDLPAKFFAVGKNFRNETTDWSHLFELIQVEGIVIDPDANMKNLKGYLIEFFKKMGYDKVRIRPGYFPYTEPSAEVDVFHPTKKKWVELGGSGIFRPEVVKTLLGIEVPVLAWGLGLERTISEYYKIQDIRELYKNDIAKLREMRSWLL